MKDFSAFLFFSQDFVDVDHFKVVFETVTILFLFYVSVFQGSNLTPLALEGKVLTTGPPGSSSAFQCEGVSAFYPLIYQLVLLPCCT